MCTCNNRKATFEKNSHTRFDVPSFFNMISIPLSTLHKIYFAAPRNSIYLVCKDYRTVRITLSGFENSKNKVETFVQVLQGITFYNQHSLDPKTHLFAYKNLTYFSNSEQGWNLCDLIKEYVRQGLFDSPDWKVTMLQRCWRVLNIDLRLVMPLTSIIPL